MTDSSIKFVFDPDTNLVGRVLDLRPRNNTLQLLVDFDTTPEWHDADTLVTAQDANATQITAAVRDLSSHLHTVQRRAHLILDLTLEADTLTLNAKTRYELDIQHLLNDVSQTLRTIELTHKSIESVPSTPRHTGLQR